MEEIWKDVVGYEGLYEVSNFGNVRSLFRYKKKLKWNICNNRYATVQLFKNKVGKRLLVHRLVAEAFLANPEKLPIVNHKDENKLNNYVNNLEWCTQGYNLSYNQGHKKRAERKRWFYDELSIKFKENNPAIKIPIIQMNLDGEIIREWESIKEAIETLGYKSNHICECCKNKRKTSNGFRWKYKEEI